MKVISEIMRKQTDIDRLRLCESTTKSVARIIETAVDLSAKDGGVERLGFAVVIFSFDGTELSYMSNAERAGMITMFKELVARLESGYRTSAIETALSDSKKSYTSKDITGAG